MADIKEFIERQKKELLEKIKEIEKLIDFKQIDGFPSYYVSKEGKIFSIKNGIFLSERKNLNEYLTVVLYNGKKRKTMYIHRLVACAFLKKENGENVVNHKDKIKSNNKVENLEWCTQKENMNHFSKNNKKFKKGEELHTTKLKNIDIKKIKIMLESGLFTYDEISNFFGVGKNILYQIKANISWKSI